MKVAQITTSLTGGAGIAAVRLSEALNSQGVDSTLLSQRSHDGKTSVASKLLTAFQRSFIQAGEDLITTISKTEIPLNILDEYDIIHFHATYNLVRTDDLVSLADKRKIVLTMHDQRAFTGGCHYSYSCTLFRQECENCLQVNKPFKALVQLEKKNQNRLINHKNVHLVSPSRWLADLAEECVSEGNRVFILNNPIPENDLPEYLDKSLMNAKNQKKFIMGFVSSNLGNPAKGLKDLVRALELLPPDIAKKIHVLMIGDAQISPKIHGISSTHIRNFSSPPEFDPYKNMDLLVVPSRQDNSPNVIGEALMSNTRVLGSSIGGIPELLYLFNCPVVDSTNPRTFVKTIENEVLKRSIHDYSTKAREIFGYGPIAQKTVSFYQSLI
jgi:glycosyltransferase involved in cell wall biosynthesis